ncbi:MAG: NAD-dependent malic enzyme [Deltaproteobacteria bacterium]|nr:NAD-dependent malic enzyme [Deltaproteobacteria bacterium]
MDFSIQIDPETREKYMAVRTKGKALLNNPFTNKGPAFTARERDALELDGLLPSAVSTIEEQLLRNYENFKTQPTDLDRYTFLSEIHDRNETLFFRLLQEHMEEMTPIVYTPTVGEACQKFSHIYRRTRGIYINYDQKDAIEKALGNFYFKHPSVIVATDGERILGLGDQGADGMGIPIGKLCLYTLGAGISPYTTLPIMLDVGTDNEERRRDPLYLGLRQTRVRGAAYQDFIDHFVDAVCNVFPHVLLQWEDLLKENAIHQLNRFKDKICSFNDDIQGTAGVVVAFIDKMLQTTGRPMGDNRILIAGAGAAAYGISNLMVSALQEGGLTLNEARKKIWLVDSKGLVTRGRPGLEVFKAIYARDPDEIASYRCKVRSNISLEETIVNARPTILIGTTATPGRFSEDVVRRMAEINERPIILPLSNPTSKTECLPEDAIRWSDGRAIVATGSPFQPVRYNGRHYEIGQCNNFFIFPGVGLGVTAGKIRRVTDGMFLSAARALSEKMTADTSGECAARLDIRRIRECSHAIACVVIRRAVSEGHARPEILKDLEETVKNAMWVPAYLPVRYTGTK